MERAKFRIVGKPLHPNKHEAVFELCEKFMADETQNESEDWILISKDGPKFNLKNKNTFEVFVCQKNYLDL